MIGIADYIKNKIPLWPNWITLPLSKLNIFKGLVYGRAYLNFEKTYISENPEKKLLRIINYAIRHVPYYRERYSGLVIKSYDSFINNIGFIDKDTVMANWEKFISDEADLSKCIIGTTGGTSGKPLKLVMPKNRYTHSMFFWHRQLKRFGWNYHLTGVIRNHHLPNNRDYMVNPIMKQVIFDAFRSDDLYFQKVWKVLKKNNIKFIHAYPSSAYAFLKSCKNQNLDTSFIRCCFLTSEAIADFQKTLISDILGIQILGSYGHSEKLCMAGTIPGSSEYEIDEEYGLTEIVNKEGVLCHESGELGEIVGTTYFNYDFPLIRYRTGDYAKIGEPNLTGERMLAQIDGRREKSLIYKYDGSYTNASALNLHGDYYERISGIQYIQDRKGYLRVLIIKDTNYTEEDDRFIRDFMSNAMGGEDFVSIEYVDKLVFNSNGKFLPLISNVRE